MVGAAVSEDNDPFGRYLDIGRPLVSSRESMGGVIDPHYFKDPPTGRSYLLWKEDKPLALQTSIIMIRELHPSGLHFIGRPREILSSSLGNLLEERLVAEAPWMMYRGGNYYLFYSSAWFSEMKYHIRVAVSKSVFGPFYRSVNLLVTKVEFIISLSLTTIDKSLSRSHTPVITTDWAALHQVSVSLAIILSLSKYFLGHQPYLFLFFVRCDEIRDCKQCNSESKYFCLIMSDRRVNERVEFGLAFASTRNTFNSHVRVRVIAAEHNKTGLPKINSSQARVRKKYAT